MNVERAQNAPGLSFIQTCLLGKPVIKAFGFEQIYLEKQIEIYNKQVLCNLTMTNCQSWYNSRVYWILELVKAFGLFICVT